MDQEHLFAPAKENKGRSVKQTVLVGTGEIGTGFGAILFFYPYPFNLGKLLGMTAGIGCIGIGLVYLAMVLFKKGAKRGS